MYTKGEGDNSFGNISVPKAAGPASVGPVGFHTSPFLTRDFRFGFPSTVEYIPGLMPR